MPDDLRETFDATGTPALATWRGRPAAGAWRLEVRDLAGSDVGKLERWWLEIVPASAPPGVLVLEESPGAAIADFPAAGIERSLVAAAAGTIARVEVELDILHSYIGDLRVVLVSPAGTVIALHERKGGQDDSIVADLHRGHHAGAGGAGRAADGRQLAAARVRPRGAGRGQAAGAGS